jgi:hypothetical protein
MLQFWERMELGATVFGVVLIGRHRFVIHTSYNRAKNSIVGRTDRVVAV